MKRFAFPPALPAGRTFDVVGLGANAADHIVTIPHHPRPGEKVRFSGYRYQGGGQTATALVTIARLGYRTAYLGGIGDDADGRANVTALAAEGVDVRAVCVRGGKLTQRAFILVDEDSGERTIIWGRSEGLIISADEVDETLVKSGRIFFTDAQDPRAAARAARAAHAAGMPVIVDLELVREGLDELLPEIDFLIAAESFLEPATGSRDIAAALRLLERRSEALVMVTRGALGAVALIDGRTVSYPAYAVDPVDTTGAGDAFHGAFAVACLRGLTLADAIDFSHAVAAMKCRALGGRAGLPCSVAELESFRQSTPHRE